MFSFLRTLPDTIWWVTLAFAGLALVTQIAIVVARSSSTNMTQLLLEFALTVALLALPVGIAWQGRQRGSLWYACGALVLLVTMGKIFFF
jgi:hypothetical protein